MLPSLRALGVGGARGCKLELLQQTSVRNSAWAILRDPNVSLQCTSTKGPFGLHLMVFGVPYRVVGGCWPTSPSNNLRVALLRQLFRSEVGTCVCFCSICTPWVQGEGWIHRSTYLSTDLSVLSIYLLYRSIYLFYGSIYRSIYPPINLSLHAATHPPSIHQCVYQPRFLSVYQYTNLSSC